MKRKIFDLLMEIKGGIVRSIRPASSQDKSIPDIEEIEIGAIKELSEGEHSSIENSSTATNSLFRKQASLAPETRYFQVEDGGLVRKIAYTISGDECGENILLCLPGLLETKSSFLIIHAYFLKFANCKVISVDFSGRGESDYIDERETYKMSLYLSDVSQLIQGVILVTGRAHQRITILGTSMGGVLAMYLTQIFGKKIRGIILNDIALTVNWTSLYMLYKSMKNGLGFREVRELAKDLSVDEKAISDVQLPCHFDLSYQADVWGMNFHESLEGFKGKVGLVYGSHSKICTKQRVDDAKGFIPKMQTLEVPNAGHPAPFNLLVCDFIQSQMGV